jgi:hypothetical protein
VAAQPAAGPRENIDQRFTTTLPDSPTGGSYAASFHAAGDPRGNPPYLRRMVVYPPRGTRFDTSVPERCTATDAELQASGPAACPAGSRLGGGTAEGLFFAPVTHAFLVDHYKHKTYLLNNANQQILLVESEGFTVVRGRMRADGSTDFELPTCFPVPPTGRCTDDYILQLKTSSSFRPYKKIVRGHVRSYATTPSRCPTRRYWRTTVRLWWADGSVDSVVSKQPCRPAPALRVKVSPRRVRVGRAVRFSFVVSANVSGHRKRVAGALVRVAGRHRRTDARGRTSMLLRFRAAGPRRVRASLPGYHSSVGWITVAPRR